MCLNPLEFIAVRGTKPGYMIVSEFAGIGNELSSVKRVNPFDMNSLKQALIEVFSENEKLSRAAR
jgi:trehalose-6-phosphate synthase